MSWIIKFQFCFCLSQIFCFVMSDKLFQLERVALREHQPIPLMFIIGDGSAVVQKSKLFLPFILNFSVHLLIIGFYYFFFSPTYIGGLYLPYLSAL